MRYYFTSLLLLCSTAAFAQDRSGSSSSGGVSFGASEEVRVSAPGSMFGLHLQAGIPTAEFAEATDAFGLGVNMEYLHPLSPKVPVYAGIQFNYQMYGRNAYNRDLTAQVTVGNNVIDVIDVPLRIATTNATFGTHLMLRAVAPTKGVQPYVQGLLGTRLLYTRTSITSRNNQWLNDDDDDEIAGRTHLHDWVFSYGAGAGLMFRFNEIVALDVRLDYLNGGKANFYDSDDTRNWDVEFVGIDPGTINDDDIDFGFAPRRSYTDMFNLNVGVTFTLD